MIGFLGVVRMLLNKVTIYVTSFTVDTNVPFTDNKIELRSYYFHLGIQAAGVDGLYFISNNMLLSLFLLSTKPSVGESPRVVM